ncbi:MAG: agmatinase [Planctomycetota bacterium]
MPTELPDSRVSPRFAGLVTFGRYPRLEDTNGPVDWAVLGVPYDTGVSYRPGTRFGPRAIRDASQYLKRYHLEHRIDVLERLSLADAGDAPVKPYHPKVCLDLVCDWISRLPEGAKPMTLGGDHSVSYAAVKAAWIRAASPEGGIATLHFDSHLDTVDSVWDEKYGHASPFIRLIEEGVIDPSRMLTVGIKGPMTNGADLDYAEQHGVTILTHDEWTRVGNTPVRDFVKRLDGAPCYITFDIDCIDPVYAPGTGTPAVGGFTSYEALSLLRAAQGLNLVGADVVEVLPDRDLNQNTALLAAHVAFEIFALDALRTD